MLQEFWISWSVDGAMIRVGEGLDVGDRQLHSFTNVPRVASSINAVAFRTGAGIKGTWIYHGNGRTYTVFIVYSCMIAKQHPNLV